MRGKLKYLLIIIPIILVLLLVFALLAKRMGGSKTEPLDITLNYWGLFEPAEVMTPLINEYINLFEERNPGSTLKINYEQRYFESLSQYKETVLTRLTQGGGPDIVRLHATWIPQFATELSSLPPEIMSVEQYNNTFYRVASLQNTVNGQIYGLPLMYDGLVLLLNKDLFIASGLALPKVGDNLTWNEFSVLAKALTKREGSKITQAGAAVGLANNIPHASDILGLMWAQIGVDTLAELTTTSAADALRFYTLFATEDKVWDESFLSALDAFIEGKVAMIFVPSWRIFEIEDLNPALEMVTTAVPQTPSTTNSKANWSSYWVEAVSADSTQAEVAWDFLKFLGERETQLKFYSYATQLRSFGEPYSRVDLAENLSSHQYLAPLVAGAPTATSWFITDMSGNDPYVELIRGVISGVSRGRSPAEELENVQQILENLAAKNDLVVK